jgi:acetyl esterase
MPHPRLTPAMRAVLERRARVSAPPLHTLAPAQARLAYEAAAGVLEVPRAPLRRVEDFTVPARDGHPLPARLYSDTEGSDPGPWLLYLHGGGFTIGSVATHDTLCR